MKIRETIARDKNYIDRDPRKQTATIEIRTIDSFDNHFAHQVPFKGILGDELMIVDDEGREIKIGAGEFWHNNLTKEGKLSLKPKYPNLKITFNGWHRFETSVLRELRDFLYEVAALSTENRNPFTIADKYDYADWIKDGEQIPEKWIIENWNWLCKSEIRRDAFNQEFVEYETLDWLVNDYLKDEEYFIALFVESVE